MKTLIKNLLGMVSLVILASVVTSCGDKTSPPQTNNNNNNDTTTAKKEFYEFNGYRIEQEEFIGRKIELNNADELELTVKWDRFDDHWEIPASEIQVAIDSLIEGDLTPAWYGNWDLNALAVRSVGYTSGTGNWIPDQDLPYGHCRLINDNGKWIVDLKDIPMYNAKDTTASGMLSAYLYWEE